MLLFNWFSLFFFCRFSSESECNPAQSEVLDNIVRHAFETEFGINEV